ncbi:ATP-dependent RNA helicase DDX55-like [Orbicella faveolata]|uniref:ATP-dependent RNA helicase DDX55-like n=1 Tax=Orbicella faveolata TaxID=48498 RepID=UPI0009E1BDD6|nr:ATP-dependent RNA helicase DDX55-like [Orbicella faveolata]
MRQNFKMAAAWSEIKPSLSHSILNVMEKLGFQTMTPVQTAAIPLFMSNKDVAVEAVSSSISPYQLIVIHYFVIFDFIFIFSINAVLGFLPKQRRTGLFSATQTDEVEALVRAGLRNPVRVTVREKYSKSKSEQRTPSTLKNFYTICESARKFSRLVAFLKTRKTCKNMVFFSTCACVNYFSKALERLLSNVKVLSIHGKMKAKRHKVFDNFRKLASGVLVCTDVMARGVDIPEVDWVIQFDPPSSAKQVPLQLFEIEDDGADVTPKLRKMAMKDRDVYEKGMKAFVSFVQFYRKHECSLIFRSSDLELGKLATGFGLLKLPVMPELKDKTVDFEPADVDVEKLYYKDKNREKQRKRKLQEQQDSNQDSSIQTSSKKKKKFGNDSVAWSKNKEKRVKREKRRARREYLKKQRQKHSFDNDELEDLAREASLVKKLKAGKISKEQFDSQLGNDEEEEN